MSEQHLKGKSVIVTGAGQGLGRAYALEVARQGGDVVVNDLDSDLVGDVPGELATLGARVEVVTGSVAEWSVAEKLVSVCAEAFGSVDGLVSNAAVLHNSLPWEEQSASLKRIVEVNVLGSMYCGVNALRHMVAQGSGAIVAITSGALNGATGITSYGVTKAAVASMVYGWALEAAGTGVRVNGVMPIAGTGMSEHRNEWFKSSEATVSSGMETVQGPEKVAPVVAYLLSDLSASLNGQIVRHDGQRIILASRSSWDGDGYQLGGNDELDVEAIADIVANLAAHSR